MRSTSRVGVLGASSLVGTWLLPILVRAGKEVTAFSRRPVGQKNDGIEWQQLPAVEQSLHSLEDGVTESWICLLPIWMLPEYFDLLARSGARRVVALSSTSRFTKVDSSDPAECELVAKLIAAEEALQRWAEARNIEWVIIRPTLIYDCRHDKNISVIAGFIRRFGFFPVFGTAKGLRQPVHAEDVARACVAGLDAAQATNRSYNISGAEVLTYWQMVSRIFLALGRRPRLLGVPLSLFWLAVACLRIVPSFRNWSPAMAERMNQDMAFNHDDAARDLNFAPRRFSLSPEDLLGESR